VPHAVDLDADPGVLSGLVSLPATPRPEVDGRRVRVSGTTAVTTPRGWRAELSGLTSQRKSSGARGVVKTDATRLRGRILLTYPG